MPPHVVFVHGLFMTGAESVLLRRHLARELGARTHTFLYMATAEDPDVVADRLGRRVRALGVGTGAGTDAAASAADGTVHLVGHSLGGLLILRALDRAAQRATPLPPGRVVLLGSPVAGSDAAVALMHRPVLGRALGRSAAALAGATFAGSPLAGGGRDIGIIAGNRPAGLGRFLAQFQEPNDGTVAVRETQLEGAVDRIVLPVSHTGMLLSGRVAREAAQFLRHGRFSLTASS